MRKLLISALFLSLSLFCFNAQASHNYSDSHSNRRVDVQNTVDLSHHHFTAGLSFSNYPAESFWLVVGGISDYWVWRLSAALFVQTRNVFTPAFALFCGAFHLGGRVPINSSFGFEYGVVTSVVSPDRNLPSSITGYTIGPFVGLDAIVVQRFLIAATLQPYTYRVNLDTTAEHAIFGQGMISFSYII